MWFFKLDKLLLIIIENSNILTLTVLNLYHISNKKYTYLANENYSPTLKSINTSNSPINFLVNILYEKCFQGFKSSFAINLRLE